MLKLVLSLARLELDLLTVQNLILRILVLRVQVRAGRQLRLAVPLRARAIAESNRGGAVKTDRSEIRRLPLDLIDGRRGWLDVRLIWILLLLLLLLRAEQVTVSGRVVIYRLLVADTAGLYQLCAGGRGLLLLIAAQLHVEARDVVARRVVRMPAAQ